jgi:hypothetical protein
MYNNSLHVNPSVRNFWRNIKKNDSDFHPFKKNRNLVFFGDALSHASYDFIVDRIDKLNIEYDMADLANAFMQIMESEQGHAQILQDLAVKAVTEAFDIPEDLLNPHLNEDSNVELNDTEEEYEDENFNYDELSQALKDLINKRILLNCVIQGASVHSFYTLHHIVKDDIVRINEDLVKLYDKFSVGSVRSYYSMDYSKLLENADLAVMSALGSAKVEYNEDNQPQVEANAKSFPVLCQELVKGAMETISLHGLQNISKEDLKKIYYFADKRTDEPRYIQISSEVWRKLLDFTKYYRNEVKKITIPELVMNISLMPIKEIENFFEHLFQKEYSEAAHYLENITNFS